MAGAGVDGGVSSDGGVCVGAVTNEVYWVRPDHRCVPSPTENYSIKPSWAC